MLKNIKQRFKKSEDDQSSDREFVFEALEPRVLLSADLAGVAAQASLVEEQASATAAEELVIHEHDKTLITTPLDNTHSETQSDSILRHEIAFVDTGAEDYQTLVNDLLANQSDDKQIEVILLDSNRNGIDQITEALAEYQNIDAVHIVSHGTDRAVKLGDTWLDLNNLDTYSDEISSWGSSFTEDVDIQFYGCDLAAGEEGRSLINQISQLTDADVSASIDDTGSAALGGDWVLEFSTGEIETDVVFSAATQQNWSGLLASFTVTNTNDSGAGSLRQAIIDANALVGTDTIDFNISTTDSRYFFYEDDGIANSLTGAVTHTPTLADVDFNQGWYSIQLGSNLPDITDTVVIDGTSQNGFIDSPIIEIDGANTAGDGLSINSNNNTIQGLVFNRMNDDGIDIDSGFSGNTIIGNYIGTDVSGTLTTGFENSDNGVKIDGNNNTIGGTNISDRNIISGNMSSGVEISGVTATGNIIAGNYIGVDVLATTILGTGFEGIHINGGASNVTIDNNIIGGATQRGIDISGASSVTVTNNSIGTDTTGTLDFGNAWEGIYLDTGASNNLIGGTTPANANKIANNIVGIRLENNAGIGNAILGNAIYDNTNLGIDLRGGVETNDVTANDAGDIDIGTTNDYQNFPVISSATTSAGLTTISGTINSTASTKLRIEFFSNTAGTEDPSGHGEGQTYLGAKIITTDGSGDTSFSFVTDALPANDQITATATIDLDNGNHGSTSEFALNTAAITVNNAPTITKDAIFTDSGQSLGSSLSTSVDMGDVDGDGDLDMVIANYNLSANKVFLNDGAGNFTDSGQNLGSSNSHGIELGDIDGDGDLDMVVVNFSNQTNKIYTNDGNGVFSDSGQNLGNVSSAHVALGDMDGDGDLDMVVGNFGANKIYTNNGAGVFTDSGQSLGTANTRNISLGDVDNDGDLDLVTGNDGQGNKVYLNDGSGILTDSLQNLGTLSTFAVHLGDLDYDGDLDLVEANQGGPSKVFLNDGSGVYTDTGQNLGGVASNSLDLGDVDSDGNLDLIISNHVGVADQVYIGNGDGTFSTGQPLGTGDTRNTVFSDIDSDGDLDLVVADFGTNNLIYLNDSAISSFAPLALTEGDPAQILTDVSIVADVDSSDFNGGNLTISYSVTGDTGDQLSVRNQGSGTGQIGFDGSNVSFGGVNIGVLNLINNGVNGNSITIDLNSNATPDAVKALLNNITFQNTSDNPVASRTLSITVNDGDGGTSSTISQVITITALNDLPSSTNATILASTNSTFVFNATHFNFSDVDTGDSLQQIRISGISGSGSLQNNGSAVVNNQVISRADIDAGLLTFTPVVGESGSNYASFNFEVHDGTAFAGATSAATINVGGLSPFFNQRIQGGGVYVDTKGMRTDAAFSGGTLTPTFNVGIPDFATVVNAYLIINELDYGSLDTTFTLDGNAVTVSQVGESADPNWGANRVVTLRADVTSIVTGNGGYTLGGADGIGSYAYEGAVLVVVYEDLTVVTDSIVTLHEGSISQLDFPVSIPMEFNAGNSIPQNFVDADLILVGFDGQDGFPEPALDFQSTTSGSPTTFILANSFDSTQGGSEQFNVDINALITQADTGAELTQTTTPTNADDYLVYPFLATVIQLDNAAPTLDNTGSMTLTSITEDQTNSTGNIVSDIILSAGGDRIDDLDLGALEGIAITSLSSGNGTWEYSTNAGVSWNAVGVVSDASALLLRNSDFLRFVPDGQNADTANLDFRAWDQTSGVFGNKVDTSTNGGNTAFSTATETTMIGVTSVNDQLTTNISINQTKNYNEDDPSVALDDIVVSDVDSGEIITATLTLTDPTFGTLTTSGTASYFGATGFWSITDTVVAVNAALANVAFIPTLNNDQNTTVSVSIVDGGENGTTAATGTITLNVTAINDVPSVTNSAGTISYTEQNPAVVIDTGLAITDPDGKNGLTNAPDFSAVVRISSNFDPNDILNFSNTANIQGNLVRDTLTLTVVAAQTATVADFEAALRSVTFSNGSDDPGILDRTVSFYFNDGLVNSNTDTRIIQFTAVNDSPALATNTGLTVNEGSTGTTITTAMLNEGDPDDSAIGIGLTYTVTTVPTNGTLRLSGTALINGNTFTQSDIDNNRVTYDHDGSETNADSFIFDLADGGEDGALPLTNQTFSIVITPVNDNAPVFTSPSAANVAENTTAVHQVVITDSDLPADTITYSIAGSGADDALFSIDGSGNLSFIVAPDFEVPTDANTDGDYVVDVSVFDGVNTSVQTITVTVTAINDNNPVFTSPSTANVVENTTAVHQVTITDSDLPADTITYSIAGSGVDNARFSIDGAGNLSFIAAPDFEVPTDANLDNDYVVEIHVSDGVNTSTQTITVTVTPVNDNFPVFTNPAIAFRTENVTGTVHTVTVSDADLPSDTFTYSIAGTGADDALFTIDGSGNLSFITSPDFEVPTDANLDQDYIVDVQVFDGINTVVQTNTIRVLPLNDNTPVFTSPGTANVFENMTAVHQVTVTDADLPGDTITYSIAGTGADDARFSIDASGNLSFNTAPDFEIPADADFDNDYVIDVQVFDGVNTVTQTITVSVLNGNEMPTTSGLTNTTVNEDTVSSVKGLFAAFDDVEDLDPALTYTITNNTNPGLFSSTTIDGIAGSLTLNYSPDQNGIANITVRATDTGGFFVESTFTVTVNPINDSPIANNNSATVNNGGNVNINLAANDSDIDNALDLTSITIISGPTNGSLVDYGDGTVSYFHNGSITLTDSFTYTINDASGASSNIATVILTISPTTNSAPVENVPPDQQINVNTDLVFSSTNGNLISILDNDASTFPLQVTLTTSDGVLSLASTANLSFSNGSGIADQTMTFTGTLTDINTAIDGLRFSADTGFIGTTNLQITVNDLGSGSGTPQTSSNSVAIVIIPDGIVEPPPPENPDPPTPDPEIPETPDPDIEDPDDDDQMPDEEEIRKTRPGNPDDSSPDPVSDPQPEIENTEPVFDIQPDLLENEISTENKDPKSEDLAKNTPRKISEASSKNNGLKLQTKLEAPEKQNFSIDPGLLHELEQIDKEISEQADQQSKEELIIKRSAEVGSVVLFVGFVKWLLQASSLFASLLGTLPAWRWVDPIPVLKKAEDDKEEKQLKKSRNLTKTITAMFKKFISFRSMDVKEQDNR